MMFDSRRPAWPGRPGRPVDRPSSSHNPCFM
jgi:hypothetical protein